MSLGYDQLKRDTRIFVSIVATLVIIGFVFIYSSSSIYALEKFGSAHYFLKKQCIYLLPALIGFFFFALVPIKIIKRYAPLLFWGALVLTMLTFASSIGLKIHGSRRWLYFFGYSVQPSELLKFSLFIYFGYFLEKKQNYLRSFARCYLSFLCVLGITFLVLLKQPDFGSVITILTTSLILFFVAEMRSMHLFVTFLATLPVVILLIVTKSYRLRRILIFLNPWSDPQGRGFQIIQSLIAIGSGNIWGLGVSNSKQKFFYLPMQHTDFIFPIIAEETGFVGSCFIILLYFLFCFFGLRIALRMKDTFSFFTTLGFVVFISLQALINLMVTIGLLPTKGLGLPFVSYGGTALVSFLCMVGLIVNCSRASRV